MAYVPQTGNVYKKLDASATPELRALTPPPSSPHGREGLKNSNSKDLRSASRDPLDLGAIRRNGRDDLPGGTLLEALLRRSWESRFRDPKAMRWLAYDALKAAESLRPEELPPAPLLDLQAAPGPSSPTPTRSTASMRKPRRPSRPPAGLLRRGSGDLSCLAEIS